MPPRLLILVAEDGAADRMLLAAIVRQQGHRVVTASNGREAVELFRRERPQLVLMDALMPVMDGFEAAREIKLLAGDELVPIIFLTSMSEHQALVRCLEAGGDDFIAKPYNPVILEAKIQAMHRLRRLQATIIEQRDLIAVRNRQLLDEQRAAKAIFDRVAHDGCLDAPNVRYRQSPRALFNGDLLLVTQTPDDRMFVLLGDFTGHGLPAAIGAMPVAETFYGMAAKGYCASDIIGEINTKLKFLLPVEMFCCAMVLDINLKQRMLQVWNGGMPDGYLLKAGGRREILKSTHLPLGVLDSAVFDDRFETLQVEPGDRLLMLSDGLLESRNRQDGLFGEQTLLAIIDGNTDSHRLFDEIEQALLDFNALNVDDLSLVEVTLADNSVSAMPGAHFPLNARLHNAMDWSAHFEWRSESLRTSNPLPLLLQLLLQIPALRHRGGVIYTVLTELYSNALEHGVLELDSSIKCDAEGFSRYYEARQQRLADLTSGFVRIEWEVKSKEGAGFLRIGVEDSGAGFDVEQTMQNYCSSCLRGRGLQLIDRLSDRFSWQPDGRSMSVEFHWMNEA